MKTQPSPLLELLDQRWQEFLKDAPDPSPEAPFRRPVYAPEFRRQLRLIAHEHGESDNSDPFAAGRVYHYMRQGYVSPHEVRKDAHAATSQRRAQGITFPAVKLQGGG